MVVWEVLDVNNDDTRQASDIGSLTSLFEVVKLAYLEPDKKVLSSDFPNLTGCVAFGYVAIAVGNSVFIFGESCSSLLIQLTLENVIDVMIWLPGGEFLFIVDGAGSIYCLHIESKKLIFSKKFPLRKSSEANSLTVCGNSFITNDGLISVIIITTSGQIVRLENIDKDALLEGLKLGDIPFLNSLQSDIRLTIDMAVDETCTAVLCAECIMLYSKLWIWIGTDSHIYCWNSESLHNTESVSYELASYSCLKLVPLLEGSYIATVGESKCLSIISSQTGITVYETESMLERKIKVIDFYELSSTVNSSQLLILAELDDITQCLLILNLPGFELTYEVTVNKNTCLLKLGEDANSISFIEPEFTSDSIVGIKLKSIVDGQPDARLEKLLKKYKFNEAEEFCGTFGLDVEEVLKAKSRHLCDLLNPWGKMLSSNTTVMDPSGTSRHLDDLLLTLGRIEDNEFVTTLCVEALLMDIGTTEKLLNYAKHRLTKASQSGMEDHLSSLMQRISKKLYCLHTFQNIFPTSDIQHWLAFSTTDMLQEFLEHLAREDLDAASTLWHRHQYEFLNSVDIDCVSRILNAIPITISSERLCAWLPKNLLKDLVKFCPSSIEAISSWIDDRIKKLEFVEKINWPHNGYNLATTAITALENVASDFYAGGNIEIQMAVHVAQRKAQSTSSYLGQLRQTAISLRDLQILAENFLMKIKYSQYTQKCKKSVVAALLDWLVSGEEIYPLMEGFLRHYMIRHELDCDETMKNYVLETLDSADHDWWLWEEAPWEDKLYSAINVITDAQIQAQCIVECARLAPVPWSDGTKKMCALGLTLNTPLRQELEMQERLGKLKIVLRRYSLHLVNFDDVRNAELILRNITNQDKEDVLDDALIVVSAFKHLTCIDAYFFRLCHLIYKELYDNGKELLLNIEEDARIVTANKFVSYVNQHLIIKSYNNKCAEKLKCLLSGVIALEEILKSNCSKNRVSATFWSDIRRINTLQIKFDVYPTLDELEDLNVCSTMLRDYIIDLYKKKHSYIQQELLSSVTMHTTRIAQNITNYNPINSSNTRGAKTLLGETKDNCDIFDKLWEDMEKIQHLSMLLGITRQALFTMLASLASQKGYLKQVLSISKLIATDFVVENFTPIVYDVIQLVVKRWKNIDKKDVSSDKLHGRHLKMEFMEIISDLVSIALQSCGPSEIAMLTDLGHWCQISKYLFNQCHQKGIYASDNDNRSDDPFVNWKFSPVFLDPSMPVEESFVTEAVTLVLEGCLVINGQTEMVSKSPFTSTFDYGVLYKEKYRVNALLDLNCHIQERSHDLLSFILSMSVYMNVLLRNSGNSCKNEVNNGFNKKISPQQITTLLIKVLSCDRKDLHLAISLLTQISVKESLKVVNDVIMRLGYDFDKLIFLGKIGHDFCKLNNLKDISLQFAILDKRATWGKRLEKLGIAFKSGFSGDKNALSLVLKQLVKHPECTFALINEFCEDFSWDNNEALSNYLIYCLHSWSPSCKEILESRKDNINEIPQSLVLKINSIILKMENKVELRQVLEDEFESFSSYNYEILELIMSHLNSLDLEPESVSNMNRGKDILQFLKVYIRQKPPGDTEKEEWLQGNPESRNLPVVSKYRLPFHELHKSKNKTSRMKIVELEVDVHSVDKWIQIADALKISMDQLYFLAAQTTVSNTLKKDNHISQEWQICSRNSTLLLQIQETISKIEHPELATACANWIVNNLPPGADKVEAARKCCLLANHWKLNSTERKVTDASKKFVQRHLQLAIEHALNKYGLAQPEYLLLANNPVELIFKLYKHPCLSSLVTLGNEDLPDIDGCVTEICSVANCNKTAIQLELLHQWLPLMEKRQQSDPDETVSNFMLVLDPSGPADDVTNYESTSSLSRVIYLLRCYPKLQAISYLYEQAFATDDNVSTNVKLKALRCLLAIADQETMQKHSVLSMEDIRSMLQTMTYVSRLESLGHATSISIFETIDKNALVEGLWRSQRHNPEALLLLIDLCCDFNILTSSLWGAMIGQLTNFTDCGQLKIGVLEKALLQIKNIPHLWLLPQLTAAWELVINYPFKKASLPLTESSLNSCVHSTNLLLQYCPVSPDISCLASLCESLELPVLRLAVIASSLNHDKDIQKILEKTPKEKLKSQYKEVKSTLVLPKFAEDILDSL